MKRFFALKAALLILLVILTFSRSNTGTLKPEPLLLNELLAGTEKTYTKPGSEWAPLLNHLPARGTFTLLTETLYDERKFVAERVQILQNYLAPRILTLEPGQKTALIEAASHETALRRAEENGYQLLHSDGKGRGILKRNS